MQNENINDLHIFENTFVYTAYADDTIFFLKDEKSEIEPVKISLQHFLDLNQTEVNVNSWFRCSKRG